VIFPDDPDDLEDSFGGFKHGRVTPH